MPMTITHGEVAARTGTTIPPHLVAQAEVPVAKQGWRQGDVYVIAIKPEEYKPPTGKGSSLSGSGHKVVQGDADRNSHILNGNGMFYPAPAGSLADYGTLVVPDDGLAVLTHTGEHGSVAFGPGPWKVKSQVSYEKELTRAAD